MLAGFCDVQRFFSKAVFAKSLYLEKYSEIAFWREYAVTHFLLKKNSLEYIIVKYKSILVSIETHYL